MVKAACALVRLVCAVVTAVCLVVTAACAVATAACAAVTADCAAVTSAWVIAMPAVLRPTNAMATDVIIIPFLISLSFGLVLRV